MKQYGVGDGMASSTVYGVYQDRQGFMWFATESGVNRFDGTEFETFTTADGLPSNTAFSFAEDYTGRLWVSCNNSRPAYFDGGRWVVDDKLLPISSEQGAIKNLSFTSQGDKLYFSFGKPLYAFKNNKATEIRIEIPTDLYELPIAIHLQTISDTLIILHAGRAAFNLKGNKTELMHIFPEEQRTHLSKSIDNLLIRALGSELQYYTVSSSSIKKLGVHYHDQPIIDVFTDRLNRVYIELMDKSIYQYLATDSSLIFQQKLDLDISKLGAVFVDRESNTWFTTIGNGVLYKTSESSFNLKVNGNSKPIGFHSVAKNPSQEILIGDAIGKVHVIKNNEIIENHIVTKKKSGRILKILPDTLNKKIWFATDQGLITTNTTFKPIHEINMPAKTLFLNQDSVLVSFFSFVGSIGRKRFNKRLGNVWNNRTYALWETKDKVLWIGDFKGLNVRKNNSSIDLGKKWPVVNIRITGIVDDENGHIWVATHGNGVAIFDSEFNLKNVLNFNNGLSSNQCQNLHFDKRGFIWVSTNLGLNKVAINNFETWHYTSTNALSDNDVNDCMADQDTIWVATSTGVARFIDNLTATNSDYSTLIRNIWANGNKKHGEIILPKDSNDLEIQLCALSYKSAGSFSYKYTLRHETPNFLDFTWKSIELLFSKITGSTHFVENIINNENRLKFSNLSAGKYHLQVAGISFDKVESSKPAELVITIRPKLIESLWVQLLFLITLFILIYKFYIWRRNITLSQLNLKQQLGHLQFEAFKTRINPHFIFNSINGVQQFFFPPDPEKANEYVTLLSTLLRKTMDMSDVNFIYLKEEIAYIKDFLAMAKLRLGNEFTYEVAVDPSIPEKTELPSMILQPLLENAIIHGTGEYNTKLSLNIQLEDNLLKCIIEDDGQGIVKKLANRARNEQHTPKGLTLINQRIQALNDVFKTQISIETLDKSVWKNGQTGTIVTLSIDLNYARKET